MADIGPAEKEWDVPAPVKIPVKEPVPAPAHRASRHRYDHRLHTALTRPNDRESSG